MKEAEEEEEIKEAERIVKRTIEEGIGEQWCEGV